LARATIRRILPELFWNGPQQKRPAAVDCGVSIRKGQKKQIPYRVES
jgi:hypothetical protein